MAARAASMPAPLGSPPSGSNVDAYASIPNDEVEFGSAPAPSAPGPASVPPPRTGLPFMQRPGPAATASGGPNLRLLSASSLQLVSATPTPAVSVTGVSAGTRLAAPAPNAPPPPGESVPGLAHEDVADVDPAELRLALDMSLRE